MSKIVNHVRAVGMATLLIASPVIPPATAASPAPSLVDDVALQLPQVGNRTLHILSPNFLELCLINTKLPDPASVTNWNFVNASNQFVAPALSAFAVTVNGQAVAVQNVGFKRRPLYAPNAWYDLRLENCLYLQLAAPVADGQQVQVLNPDGSLWGTNVQFVATADPLRYSPAIHVNQEGYVPAFPKKAMIGYYAGNLGELPIPTAGGFNLVDAQTGAIVYQGVLTARPDAGYNYTPTPYQAVYQADFSSFTTPGAYQLQVPGLGASLPFQINDGVAMAFARAYALGLYHQRCGTSNALPYTRFTHGICHWAAASVPLPQTNFVFTWNTISNYASTINTENPPQIAPLLTSPSAQLFPYVNTGAVAVAGGHHDAGDYSKYTINVTKLIHTLMFAVDALPGVAAIDNLGIPESGDGISDFMQEAKWEADFLATMQDADGGFYFLVYPQNREYESNVLPDQGDPQVVWPKNTSATAAAVAALAQCASSPRFKQTYPATASLYAQKAQLGWNFLTNAIAKYGLAGSYQKITFYGDHFTHNDELAWAACEMFLLTGNPVYQQQLLAWFDPSSSATWLWGWWHMCESYGNCIRSFAFAAQTGRISASQLDPTFLAKCQTEIATAGTNNLTWCQDNAYGSSFPLPTKAVLGAGWYFSSDQAFDMTVACQLNPSAAYLDAILQNMNFEGGCNPVNVSYVAGLGQKRPRENVSQCAQNDRRVMPPTGLAYGNIDQGFTSLYYYGSELSELCFPQDGAATSPYPTYDRWGDAFNVTAEYITLNLARSAASLAYVSTLTSVSTQAWQAVPITIVVPTNTALLNQPATFSLQAPGFDLSTARVVWEARDQEPAFGANFTIAPVSAGTNWIEAEVQWPDGRRLFAATNFYADGLEDWVDDAVPRFGITNADGGDGWNWVSTNPTPYSGMVAHQSNIAAGEHEHYFYGTTVTMAVNSGDTLFAYVYLDPANLPSEVMLMWFDGANWEHRAYWGANDIAYGNDGTVSRFNAGPLPAAGQWVKLSVAANNVGLGGSLINGMGFTLYNGRATWDYAGKIAGFLNNSNTNDTTPPAITLTSPLAGTVLAGSVVVAANATDDVAVASVQFQLDGANLGSAVTAAPYSVTWNTTTVTNGTHTLGAVAKDSAGNTASAAVVSVTVSNAVAGGGGSTNGVDWVDDALPAGATGGADGGDGWNWISNNPPPYSGLLAHQSNLASGLHEHYFNWATATLQVATGDTLFTYVYLDATNPPTEIMLSWNDGSTWEHRAYWGADSITYGTDGTASRYYMGPLPAAGQWVELLIPANVVAVGGSNLVGMGFSLYNGRATWDYSGKFSVLTTTDTTPPSVSLTSPATGAVVSGSVTVSANATDDVAVASVQFQLDGFNLGAALTVAPYTITWDTTTTANGAHTLTALAKDAAGNQASASISGTVNNPLPAVTVVASTANASRVGLVPGAFTLQRSGSTASSLTVNYSLGGTASNGVDYSTLPTSVSIPAGTNTVVLSVTPLSANYLVGSESVILTLATNNAYTVGSPASATATLAGNSVPILSIKATFKNVMITWSSTPGKIYRVAYRNSTTSAWQNLSGLITATSTTTSYTDTTANKTTQRYYAVYVTD